MNHTMKEIPESQRPYEKCIREGENTLSDSELLAVILRCGTRGMNSLTLANDILSHMEQSPYPGLLGLLHCSVSDLKDTWDRNGQGSSAEVHRRIIQKDCQYGCKDFA
jgi:DNA repair protein RadC